MTSSDKFNHSSDNVDAKRCPEELTVGDGHEHRGRATRDALLRLARDARRYPDEARRTTESANSDIPRRGSRRTLLIDGLLSKAALRELNHWRSMQSHRAARGAPLGRAGLVSPQLRKAMIEALFLDMNPRNGCGCQTSSSSSAHADGIASPEDISTTRRVASEEPLAESSHDSTEEGLPEPNAG